MITVVGLSHKTAPIDVRERLSLQKQRIPTFLEELVKSGAATEALLVSTCNRVELVAAGAAGIELGTIRDACMLALEREAPGIHSDAGRFCVWWREPAYRQSRLIWASM